jgi:cytochrome c oxidase subunit 2
VNFNSLVRGIFRIRPPVFGSRLAAVLLALVPALLLAGTAAAAPGGIGPPDPVSGSGEAINQVYWVVFTLCAVVFVLVEAALILFIVRFRRRPAVREDDEGPQIHGNTRLEVIWTIIPAVLLAGMAVFVLARTPAVQAGADGDEALTIRVQAHQFYWQYEYPNGAITLDTLRLPVDRPIRLELLSRDVDHSWWVPELTGKRDAIPGQTNVLEFEPKRTGTFEGECAEHCGAQHAVMYTQVEVVEQGEFDSWLPADRRQRNPPKPPGAHPAPLQGTEHAWPRRIHAAGRSRLERAAIRRPGCLHQVEREAEWGGRGWRLGANGSRRRGERARSWAGSRPLTTSGSESSTSSRPSGSSSPPD